MTCVPKPELGNEREHHTVIHQAMNEKLLKYCTAAGQQYLLTFWDQLDASDQTVLAEQIERLDFDLIARLYAHRDDQGNIRELADKAVSPPAFRLDGHGNRHSADEARRRGEEALAAGQVGVVVVAGGQGTRLGFEHPKGMFPIGPVSGRTLFQIHVERILAASRRYGVRIPFMLMTSPATHDETVAFFAENKNFGLADDDLVIFCQGTMPAVDMETGRVLLAEPGRLALSPDGHGGTLAALERSGALAKIQERGIRHLFYFQVDNPLVAIGDPEFLGYHLLSEAEMSTQVVAKQDPMERVGNVVEVDGRLMVIEYSDLPDDVAQRRAADGSLDVWAGSIAVHVFDVDFLARSVDQADALPFHIARKKVAYVDADGQLVTPDEPNAIKFERFIFDLMPSARNAIVVEIDPAEAFAPLKNAPGAERDTPEWVQQQMVAQHRRWLEAAGAEVADSVAVEISPLWALDREQVAEKIEAGTRIERTTFFEAES